MIFLQAGCLVVTILLHYFFLAVFAWALCEGISIYVLFVAIFYKGIFQRLRFFLLLGWGKLFLICTYITVTIPSLMFFIVLGLPLPIVIVSAVISHEDYGIKEDDGNITA